MVVGFNFRIQCLDGPRHGKRVDCHGRTLAASARRRERIIASRAVGAIHDGDGVAGGFTCEVAPSFAFLLVFWGAARLKHIVLRGHVMQPRSALEPTLAGGHRHAVRALEPARVPRF